MEDSGFSAMFIAVYVFIFIAATSITVFLFLATINFSEEAYEFGKLTSADSVVETNVENTENTITGAELLTYYYNFVSDDKYGSGIEGGTSLNPASDFIFRYGANTLALTDIVYDATYILRYSSVNTATGKITITVERK